LLAITTALATATVAAAQFRRRCRPCPCPCPSVPVILSYPAPTPTTGYFTSPKGRLYRVTVSQEPEYKFERRAIIPLEAARPGPDDYAGHDRKAAKTSVAMGPLKSYVALGDLLDELQQTVPDSVMLNR